MERDPFVSAYDISVRLYFTGAGYNVLLEDDV